MLENRTHDSKVELDIMNALDEMQSLNARHERVPSEQALAAVLRRDIQVGTLCISLCSLRCNVAQLSALVCYQGYLVSQDQGWTMSGT